MIAAPVVVTAEVIGVVIAVTIEAVIAVVTAAVAGAGGALAGVAVAPAAAVVEAVEEDRHRVDAICLLRNTLRRRVIAIHVRGLTIAPVLKIAAPPTVQPAAGPRRLCMRTISFCQASLLRSIARAPWLLRSSR